MTSTANLVDPDAAVCTRHNRFAHPTAFVDFVRSQTDCVGVTVRYTTSVTTDAGFTVRPIGTRGWFAHGDTVEVWIEAESGAE